MNQDQIMAFMDLYQFINKLCHAILDNVHKFIDHNILLLNVPLHSINQTHQMENHIIRIETQNPPLLKQSDYDEAEPKKNVPQQWLNSSIKVASLMKKSQFSLFSEKNQIYRGSISSKKKKQRQKHEKNQSNYLKYTTFIDLGYLPTCDGTQELIRKRKEDEITKKILLEEADRKKILNKKKQDRQLIETLMKEKKELIFTYDYDGNLLPVCKLEGLKYLTSLIEMNYRIDYDEYNKKNDTMSNTFIKSNFKSTMSSDLVKLNQLKESQDCIAQFYKNFENIDIVSGALFRCKGRTSMGESTLPNLEFLRNKNKDIQKIQYKHYLQYIKHGNLKRYVNSEKNSQQNIKKVVQHISFKQQKQTKQKISNGNIIVQNQQLIKKLISHQQKPPNHCENNQILSSKSLANINRIDQFNISNVFHKNHANPLYLNLHKPAQYPKINHKNSFKSLHKIRVNHP